MFYHRVGKPQSDDQLIYENSDHPDWRLHADVSDDGQYLVLALRGGTELHNRLYFIDLDNPKRPESRRAARQAVRRRRRAVRLRRQPGAGLLPAHVEGRAAQPTRRRRHQHARREPVDARSFARRTIR